MLAALAQEYTSIQRLVIVRNDADRVFVGLISPAAMRHALSARFPELQKVLRDIRSDQKPGEGARQYVWGIGEHWSHRLFGEENVPEAALRQLVSHGTLKEWLGTELETNALQWSGVAGDKQLYSKILRSGNPYVPLLRGRGAWSR